MPDRVSELQRVQLELKQRGKELEILQEIHRLQREEAALLSASSSTPDADRTSQIPESDKADELVETVAEPEIIHTSEPEPLTKGKSGKLRGVTNEMSKAQVRTAQPPREGPKQGSEPSTTPQQKRSSSRIRSAPKPEEQIPKVEPPTKLMSQATGPSASHQKKASALAVGLARKPGSQVPANLPPAKTMSKATEPPVGLKRKMSDLEAGQPKQRAPQISAGSQPAKAMTPVFARRKAALAAIKRPRTTVWGGVRMAEKRLKKLEKAPEPQVPKPAKKDKNHSSVVKDERYACIITSVDSDDLVEIACKYCKGNASGSLVRPKLFKGAPGLASHIRLVHGKSLRNQAVAVSCAVKELSPEEAQAVREGRYDVYAPTPVVAASKDQARWGL